MDVDKREGEGEKETVVSFSHVVEEESVVLEKEEKDGTAVVEEDEGVESNDVSADDMKFDGADVMGGESNSNSEPGTPYTPLEEVNSHTDNSGEVSEEEVSHQQLQLQQKDVPQGGSSAEGEGPSSSSSKHKQLQGIADDGTSMITYQKK